MNLYQSPSYRDALKKLIQSRPNGGRGVKLRLAEALRCQPTQVSSVLNGKIHFTPEQAEITTRFFGLTEEQRELFMAMVLHDRAGTASLRDYYKSKVKELRARVNRLENQVSIPAPKDIDASRYYQSWIISVVHMAGLIQNMNNAEAIATRFQVDVTLVAEAIEFLVAQKMAIGTSRGFSTVQDSLFLPKNSPHLTAYHLNWRANGMAKITRRRDEDLHFTAVAALSKDAHMKINELLRESIRACTEVVPLDPHAEDVFAIVVDSYRV